MKTILLAVAAAALALAAPARAQQQGDWTIGLGLHQVSPKSDNGTLDGGLVLDIDGSLRPTVTFEYFIRDKIGIEVLAAWPFKHDIAIDGLGKVGSTQQLPPVVSIQYHFVNDSAFTPFLGVGINYTTFFSEKTEGALAGTDLSIDDSWGVALHAGFDYALSERGALRLDLRWIDINADVSVDGTNMGQAKIDPLVFGAAYVMRF